MKAIDISRNNREKKYALFLKELKPTENDRILDVGFANIEYSIVDNFLEKNYPYQNNITALGIDEYDNFKKSFPNVNAVRYDGKIFPFEDNSFDIGWSNAVLEHVGREDAQIQFLKELKRTCKKLYFTTPNRYFPFELHTKFFLIHWLPKLIFDKIISFTSARWATGDFMYLLSERKLRSLMKKAGITHYKIHRNRFGGFTMDFSVIVNQ